MTYRSGVTEKATNVVKGAGAALGAFIITWCKMNDWVDVYEKCGEVLNECQSPGNHKTWVNRPTYADDSPCMKCFLSCVRTEIGRWDCGGDLKKPFPGY